MFMKLMENYTATRLLGVYGWISGRIYAGLGRFILSACKVEQINE